MLKKGPLKTNYNDLNSIQMEPNLEEEKKAERDENYDSEDPEEYKDITLFNGMDIPKSSGARKTNIKPLKKLVDK